MGVLLALFFGALTLMLTLSNGVIAYSSLFGSRETAFLLSRPFRPETVFLYKLADGIVFSSWAFFFMGLPLIFAYGHSEGAPWHFYPTAVALFVVFVALPAGVGSGGALILGTWFSHRPKRLLVALGGIASAVGAAWILRSYEVFRLRGSAYDVWMRDVLARLSWSESPFLPSYWMAQGILQSARGHAGEALFFLLVTLANSLLVLCIVHAAARRYYLRAYHDFHGIARRRQARPHRLLRRAAGALLAWARPEVRVLVVKDAVSFLRDPFQWSQALVFFGLIGVYVLNLRSLNYHVQSLPFKNMVAFLNLTATSLTLSTFTNRFVFPLPGLEGRRFWVLGLAPIRRSDILFAKFLFAFGGCFLVAATLMVASDLLLKVGAAMMGLHLFAVTVISAGVSGLSVGLGAIYANLREDNPSRIVSGFGGTLNLVLSLFLVGLTVVLLAVPCHLYLVRGLFGPGAFRGWIAAAVVAVALAGAAACVVPLALGSRALERLEA